MSADVLTQATALAQGKVGERTSAELVDAFLTLDRLDVTTEAEFEAVSLVRSWLMDELGQRGDDGMLAAALDLCPLCWADLDAGACSDGCPLT